MNKIMKSLSQKDSRILQVIISDYCHMDIIPDYLIDYSDQNEEPLCSSCWIEVVGTDKKTGEIKRFSLLWLWIKSLMHHNQKMDDIMYGLSFVPDDFYSFLELIKRKIYCGQHDIELARFIVDALGYAPTLKKEDQLQKLVDSCFIFYKK